ncbi:unnamed protein product [Ixodes persulcatus]
MTAFDDLIKQAKCDIVVSCDNQGAATIFLNLSSIKTNCVINPLPYYACADLVALCVHYAALLA